MPATLDFADQAPRRARCAAIVRMEVAGGRTSGEEGAHWEVAEGPWNASVGLAAHCHQQAAVMRKVNTVDDMITIGHGEA